MKFDGGNPLAIGNYLMAISSIGETRWQKAKKLFSRLWYVLVFLPGFFRDCLKKKEFWINWGKSWVIAAIIGFLITYWRTDQNLALSAKSVLTFTYWFMFFVFCVVLFIGSITGWQMWRLDEIGKHCIAGIERMREGLERHFAEQQRWREMPEEQRWAEYARASQADMRGHEPSTLPMKKK